MRVKQLEDILQKIDELHLDNTNGFGPNTFYIIYELMEMFILDVYELEKRVVGLENKEKTND